MRILVFSKFKKAALKNRVKKADDGLVVEVLPYNALERTLPSLGRGSLLYLDISGLGAKEQDRRIAVITEHPEHLFGIIDFTGSSDDPASFFHRGAVDYIGKHISRIGLSARRVGNILTYARSLRAHAEDVLMQDLPRTVQGWVEIVEGKEYPFYFLFVEIDGAEEMKKRYGQEDLARALETFRSFVERSVIPYGGRIWMWSGFGGIVLFPFGDQGCPPLICALRILLWRPFYDVEESPLPYYLSFRLALSLGVTAYREKRTGRIISDALNSAFHLGQRFTERGTFTLTGDVFRAVPESVKGFCMPAGVFEGKKIYRVRIPVYPNSQNASSPSQAREGG